ncbi:MAG: hypothetical protein AB7S75_07170 [Desulfococcaceae bacterium]
MKIYLDNCCFNRLFDNQSSMTVKLESDAKIFIQNLVKQGQVQLIWSFILDFENSANPYKDRKEWILAWEFYAEENIALNKSITARAEHFLTLSFKKKDAIHISCAIAGNCEYFITTDKGILDLLQKSILIQ